MFVYSSMPRIPHERFTNAIKKNFTRQCVKERKTEF